MKCPYCKYIDEDVNPDYYQYGDFFENSGGEHAMFRESEIYERQNDFKKLYGCPKCNKTFMESF